MPGAAIDQLADHRPRRRALSWGGISCTDCRSLWSRPLPDPCEACRTPEASVLTAFGQAIRNIWYLWYWLHKPPPLALGKAPVTLIVEFGCLFRGCRCNDDSRQAIYNLKGQRERNEAEPGPIRSWSLCLNSSAGCGTISAPLCSGSRSLVKCESARSLAGRQMLPAHHRRILR
jgi:hypothetical protein